MTPTGEAAQSEKRSPERMLTLRVIAFRRGDYWYAECLDLNLMTRKSDLASALQALREQIQLYLECALESGEFDKRVPRRAPLRDWLRYYAASYLAAIQQFTTADSGTSTFKLPFDLRGHLLGA